MFVRDETQTGRAAESRIVPRWAWVLAGIGLISMFFVFTHAVAHRPDAPPAAARIFLGLVVGTLLACYFLAVVYVSYDAKRRGMNRVLWTAVAILIPNLLGFVLYCVLRQPMRCVCPQCGHSGQTRFNFCPQCGYRLSVSCPHCQQAVELTDVYCHHCGAELRQPSAPQSAPH